MLEADGKTPAINSDQDAQVIEWYKELYKDAMDPRPVWGRRPQQCAASSRAVLRIHNPISPYAAAVSRRCRSRTTSITPRQAGPAAFIPRRHQLGFDWKFSKNQDLAKDLPALSSRRENYDAWIVASQGFNHPPLKNLADHPIWSQNPKLSMLPKEAEYAHVRGWPAKPSAAVQLIQVNYILPDMVAKAVSGMPTKRAMAWGEEQVKLAVQGKLKEGGA